MNNRVQVKINLPVLLAHLSREEGRRVSTDEAAKWLHDAGFEPTGQYWTVVEADLGHLEPSEVLEILPADRSR